jgi:hypothetical protein
MNSLSANSTDHHPSLAIHRTVEIDKFAEESQVTKYENKEVTGDVVQSKEWHYVAVQKLFDVTTAGVQTSSLGCKSARKDTRNTQKIDRRNKITGEVTEAYLNQRSGTWKAQKITRAREKVKHDKLKDASEWDQYVVESMVYEEEEYAKEWFRSMEEYTGSIPTLNFVADDGKVCSWNDLSHYGDHPWLSANRTGFVTDIKKLTSDDTVCAVSLIKSVYIIPYTKIMRSVLDTKV